MKIRLMRLPATIEQWIPYLNTSVAVGALTWAGIAGQVAPEPLDAPQSIVAKARRDLGPVGLAMANIVQEDIAQPVPQGLTTAGANVSMGVGQEDNGCYMIPTRSGLVRGVIDKASAKRLSHDTVLAVSDEIQKVIDVMIPKQSKVHWLRSYSKDRRANPKAYYTLAGACDGVELQSSDDRSSGQQGFSR